MKKAKIMLLAIAVLATVGGAVAFKVQKFGESKYCYVISEDTPPAGECTSFVTQASMSIPPNEPLQIWYTTTTGVTTLECTEVTECPLRAVEIRQ